MPLPWESCKHFPGWESRCHVDNDDAYNESILWIAYHTVKDTRTHRKLINTAIIVKTTIQRSLFLAVSLQRAFCLSVGSVKSVLHWEWPLVGWQPTLCFWTFLAHLVGQSLIKINTRLIHGCNHERWENCKKEDFPLIFAVQNFFQILQTPLTFLGWNLKIG